MKSKSLIRNSFWTLIAVLVLGHLGGGWYFTGELIEDGFTPDPAPIVESSSGVELREVTYTSPAGDMDAWYIPSTGSTWVIHVHGKGATPAEAEHLFGPLRDAGYSQLAITYRNDDGQPQDPSGYYQYGATEWEDVAAAVDFAEDNGAENVILSGFSTGASHILSFVYRNNLDIVSGLMFDSPNIDLGETVEHNAAQRRMPLLPMNVPPTISQVAKFMTSLRIGVNWKSIDYVEKAGRSLRVPVLVHHGTADLTVPVDQSVEFGEASPDLIRVVRVEGAGHVQSHEVDPDSYMRNVLDFLASLR